MIRTTLASSARLIVMALEQRGIDGELMMREVGLDPGRMADRNARFPFSGMTHLWQRAVQESGDECLGLEVSKQIYPTALHGLGFAWLASDSLTDAMRRLVRYFRVTTTVGEAAIDHQDDRYRLQIRPAAPGLGVAPAAIDATAAGIVHLCRMSAGEVFRPLRVELPRPRPGTGCVERLIHFLRAPIEFDTPVLAIEVDAALADRPLAAANIELAHANEKVLVDYLAHLDRNAIGMQVKARLVDILPSGEVSEETMANGLNLSTRSLQRRLKDEQTSYKRLLDETRRELALQYLGNSRLSINEVTYLLGFSDPSNFTRAFKRWQGIPPSQYRESRTG